jgi:hypothetical protein
MLLSLLIIPIIGGITLMFINEESKIKIISLIVSLINFILSLVIWIKFDENYHSYQFIEEWTSISYCHFHLGIDGISLPFIILTTFIIPICILASWTSIKKNIKYFYILFLILESLLIAVFLVLDLLLFYITFESCLIPMFLIIGIWGSRERKILASSYFFLYTLFGSLFMLWSTLEIFSNLGTIDFQIISLTEFSDESLKGLIWLGFFLAFAIKTPIIPFHLWLSEAHTEAPIGGSIILAGILLKLATYGFLRVNLGFLPDASLYFTPFIFTLAAVSVIYSSFTILRSIDLKRIIAYSSIGQYGPENIKCSLQQTICGKFKKHSTNVSLYQNTNNVSSLFNFIDSVLVKIFVILNNPQITNALSTLVGISEAIRLLLIKKNKLLEFENNGKILKKSLIYQWSQKLNYSTSLKNKNKEEKRFNEWLSGLIDGDGYFYNAKNSNSSGLEITMDLRDERCLYLIKQKFGGSIKLRSGAKAVRYRLYHKEGLLSIIHTVNGLIRNPIRLLQLNLLCQKYNIELIHPKPLEYNNGWLSGFFDADGHITINSTSNQLFIAITQKNKLLLDELMNLYGGKIYIHNPSSIAFRWVIFNENESLSVVNNYFHINPLRSKKLVRLTMIKRFYELKNLKAHLAFENSVLNKAWIIFLDKWQKDFQ